MIHPAMNIDFLGDYDRLFLIFKNPLQFIILTKSSTF